MPTLRIPDIFDSEERSIVAIERLDVLTARHPAGAIASASIRPIAVVVHDDRGARVIKRRSVMACERRPDRPRSVA